jgi:hypothetical protein
MIPPRSARRARMVVVRLVPDKVVFGQLQHTASRIRLPLGLARRLIREGKATV